MRRRRSGRRLEETPRCPAHPYPGRAIYAPERALDCIPDCWTRIPLQDLRGPGKPLFATPKMDDTPRHWG